MRKWFLIAVLLASPEVARAQSLSKEDIAAMKQANVSDDVVVKQIETNGVSFTLSATDVIELKKKGYSDRLLQAMLGAKPPTPPAPAYATFRAMYAAQNFSGLADALNIYLRDQKDDYRARALYALTLLRLNDKPGAIQQLELLRASHTPEALNYVQKFEKALNTVEENQKKKKEIIDSLRQFNSKAARAAIEKLDVPLAQQEYLNATLDVFEANFDSARNRLSEMSKSADRRDAQVAQQSLKQLDELQGKYNEHLAAIHGYLYSPYMPAGCSASGTFSSKYEREYLEKNGNSVSGFVAALDAAARISPLSSEILSLQFLRLMITTKDYATFKKTASAILESNGSVTVPFYAQQEFFDVVIDLKEQRIFTHPHPVVFFGGLMGKGGKNSLNGELKTFDVHFNEIQSIEQNAGSANVGAMFTKNYSMPGRHLFALRIEPGGGTAPHYAFMHNLHCTVGQGAQQTATRNLGQFVADLAPKATGNKIVVPDEKFGAPADKFFLGFVAANSAMYQAAGGMPGGLTDLALQYEKTTLEESIQSADRQRTSAAEFSTASWLSVIDTSAFSQVEKLLELI